MHYHHASQLANTESETTANRQFYASYARLVKKLYTLKSLYKAKAAELVCPHITTSSFIKTVSIHHLTKHKVIPPHLK
jgi:hypothetical protein